MMLRNAVLIVLPAAVLLVGCGSSAPAWCGGTIGNLANDSHVPAKIRHEAATYLAYAAIVQADQSQVVSPQAGTDLANASRSGKALLTSLNKAGCKTK
jgi:hypothetical protein